MNQNTVTDLCTTTWAALKSTSSLHHGTVYSGEHSGTATTDTPGLGKTVVSYEYDANAESVSFTIVEKPNSVPAEVVWFALGGQVAHASGASPKSA